MKKYIGIVLVMVMVFVLSACQPTPEEAIVVKKDTDRLVEMAQATPQPDEVSAEEQEDSSILRKESLRERLGIPERYEDTIQHEGDKLKIIVDTDVQVPSEEHIPVARAKAGNFSQELVSKFYDRLIGDTTMYQYTYQRTKAELEEEIIRTEKWLVEAKDKFDTNAVEGLLADLYREYENAPEEISLQRADDTLLRQRREYEETDILDGSQEQLNIMENKTGGKTLFVLNNVEYDSAGAEDSFSYVDEQGNTQIFTPSSGATLDYNRCGARNSLIEYAGGYVHVDATDQSLSGEAVETSRLSVTAKEARIIVEEFLADMGLVDMTVDRVCLMSNVYPGELEADEVQAWQCTLLRTVNGVSIVSDLDVTHADGSATSAEWANEKFFITVDDEGIRDIHWKGPLDVTEIVAQSSAMLPFDQIMGIFEKMMRVQYEPRAREFEQGVEYRITKIRLSLQRISEADSFTTGLIVPIWNFYGGEIINCDNYVFESPWPLMTINGIDGSVIDIHKGY